LLISIFMKPRGSETVLVRSTAAIGIMPPSSLPSKVMMIFSHHRMDKDALVASLYLMDRPHVTAKGNPP
jgi:hypothetical protein